MTDDDSSDQQELRTDNDCVTHDKRMTDDDFLKQQKPMTDDDYVKQNELTTAVDDVAQQKQTTDDDCVRQKELMTADDYSAQQKRMTDDDCVEQKELMTADDSLAQQKLMTDDHCVEQKELMTADNSLAKQKLMTDDDCVEQKELRTADNRLAQQKLATKDGCVEQSEVKIEDDSDQVKSGDPVDTVTGESVSTESLSSEVKAVIEELNRSLDHVERNINLSRSMLEEVNRNFDQSEECRRDRMLNKGLSRLTRERAILLNRIDELKDTGELSKDRKYTYCLQPDQEGRRTAAEKWNDCEKEYILYNPADYFITAIERYEFRINWEVMTLMDQWKHETLLRIEDNKLRILRGLISSLYSQKKLPTDYTPEQEMTLNLNSSYITKRLEEYTDKYKSHRRELTCFDPINTWSSYIWTRRCTRI